MWGLTSFRLWRCEACTHKYEANKDDEDFDIANLHFNHVLQVCTIILTGNFAACARRRICTKQDLAVAWWTEYRAVKDAVIRYMGY